MTTKITHANCSEFVAQVIRNIPRSDRDSVRLQDLLPPRTALGDNVQGTLLSLITLLEFFGAVCVEDRELGSKMRVKARSEGAIYFLRSLAEYVDCGLSFVSNWEREGVGSDVSFAPSLMSGPKLVYLMERKRMAEYKVPKTIRDVMVSQTVIKARIRGEEDPVYLVQYDDKAQQYQMIGGRMRSTDRDSLTVMKRELAEELPRSNLVFDRDYQLRELANDLHFTGVSPTFGALSNYQFTIYQSTFKRPPSLSPVDRWVTLEELLAGKTSDGMNIAQNITATLNEKLPGGLSGLALSFDEDQERNMEVDESHGERTITIFLASSSELREDRDAFDLHFRQQNDWFRKQGVYLKIIRWENFLDAMAETRLQDKYNKTIRQCDILVSLFATKTGKFTEEEFDVAHEAFKTSGKPLIYTYFKDVMLPVSDANKQSLMSLWAFQEKLSKLEHFFTQYDNTEHLKRHFADQLNILLAEGRV